MRREARVEVEMSKYREETFYLRADVAYGNGTTWSSGEIRGEIAKSWKILLVKTGNGSQDIGAASMQQMISSPIELQVKWLDKPELQVEKNADKSGKTYKLGDIITYTLDVTQQIEKAIAKNVVITDTILTEGVKLQKNSVILLNENGEKIPDAKITVQGNSYTIHAGEFLEGPESGQKYTVEYQVAITDESVIGKEIEKELENTPEKKTEKNAQKEKMINLMNRYHSSTGADKAEVVQELLEEVQGFLGFAITKYFPAFKQECYEDLYQECVVAFLENIDKYDPEKATITNFLTYPLIHAMCSYTNMRTNKCSSYYSGIMNRVRKAKKDFEMEGHNPSVADIALKTNLSVNKVETALRQITAADEVRYETDADLDAMVREYMKTPEDQVLEEEIQETLKKSFRKLSEKDLKLVFIAFGFEDGTPKSTNQVAKLAGLSVNETSKSIARSLRLLADDEDLMHLFGKSKSHKKKDSANKALTLSLIPNDNIMDLFENLDEEDDKKKMDQIPDTEYDGTFVINF